MRTQYIPTRLWRPAYKQHPKDAATRISCEAVPDAQQPSIAPEQFEWIPGKSVQRVAELRGLYQKMNNHWPVASLFPDPGVFELDGALLGTGNSLQMPRVSFGRIINYELAGSKATLVDNHAPFVIESSNSDDRYRTIFYFDGPKYLEEYVLHKSGIFLEEHKGFAQVLTPLHREAGGFGTLGRWEGEESVSTLHLTAVEVPFGRSIIIQEGCFHGDSTVRGFWQMAITANHTLMATADSVFLRSRDSKKCVHLKLAGISYTEEDHGRVMRYAAPFGPIAGH